MSLLDYPYELQIRIDIPDAYQKAKGPSGKLADAELWIFGGPLEGLRLVGFTVWHNTKAPGGVNVTFPARSYMAGGVKRSFTLLRDHTPETDHGTKQLIELVSAAYHLAAKDVGKGGFAAVTKQQLLLETLGGAVSVSFTAHAKDLL